MSYTGDVSAGNEYVGDGKRSCSVGSCTGKGAGTFVTDNFEVCVCDELGSPLGGEVDRHSLLCSAGLLELVLISSTAK